ncbi:hypothetical protein OLMES_5143 [Oleiphilus messinensis]|uniref:Uncharacterized protein n=1 Tax=Oleiphilus messinensis TaxID=141451 RepID=A0A1Y0IF10_9GAMM|nr:hypothetical protein OLMES_5143 [Oleiphilus messinensis]
MNKGLFVILSTVNIGGGLLLVITMMSRFFFEVITDSYLSPNSPLLGSIFLDVLIHPAVAVLYSATVCFSVVY